MTDPQMLTAVLSSSLISATLASLLTGTFALRGKRQDYVNDYFRQVLQRRIEAYQLIETLIFNFKSCFPSPDLKMVHIVFGCGDVDDPGNISALILRTSAQAFWLSDEIFAKSHEIDILLLQRPEKVSWVEYGASQYEKFATIRTELEKLYSRDLATLHEIPKFLKSKRHRDQLQPIMLPREAGTVRDTTTKDGSVGAV